MLKPMLYPIAKIQVPAKRLKTLDAARAGEIAESILQDGQKTPIQLRKAGEKFVLIEGLHRLEALKALGETEIEGYLVQARRH